MEEAVEVVDLEGAVEAVVGLEEDRLAAVGLAAEDRLEADGLVAAAEGVEALAVSAV